MVAENCWKKASEVGVTWIEPTEFHVRSASYNSSATANVDRYQGCKFALDQEGRKKTKRGTFPLKYTSSGYRPTATADVALIPELME
jgi:hypothetical protein